MIRVSIVILSVLSFQSATAPPAPQSTRLSEAVASLLRKHAQSGGIVEFSDCHSSDQHFEMTSNSDVPSALSSLPPSTHLRWQILSGSSTYLVEIGSSPADSLLATRLPDLVIGSRDLSRGANLLFTNKLVSAKTAQLGLRFYDRDFGFSPSNKIDERPTSELKLPAGTLAEDLNRLAAQNPGAVWMFTQNSCNDRVTGSFAWVSR